AAHAWVHFVPGSCFSRICGCKIKVASESRTFHSVRCDLGISSASGLRWLGVSWSGKMEGIIPDSHSRPAGHQPPHGKPHFCAAQRPALSTPVFPQNKTLFILAFKKALLSS